MKEGTRVYTAFYSSNTGVYPYAGSNPAPRRDYLLEELRREVKDIEFIGGDIIRDFDELVNVENRTDIDAILVYVLTGAIWTLTPWTHRKGVDVSPFKKHPMIVISDFISGFRPSIDFWELSRREGFPVHLIHSSSFEDVKSALHLVKVIHSIRNSKILYIGPFLELKGVSKEILSAEQCGFWRLDAELCLKNLKEVFGTELIVWSADQLQEYYKNADEKEAEDWARRLIAGAMKVVVPGEESIKQGVKLYLAMKKAVKDTGADVITVDDRYVTSLRRRLGDLVPAEIPDFHGPLDVLPCWANCQLNDDGITAVAEGDLYAAVTHLMMRYLANISGFSNDPIIDTASNQLIYAHCCTIRKWEGTDSAPLPYELRTSCQGFLAYRSTIPLNKIFTSVRINIPQKKMAIHQGRSIGVMNKEDVHLERGPMSLEERGDLNKFIVEANAKKILEKFDYGTFGWHRSIFCGDYREPLKNIAALLGLEVIEEDRD